MEEETKTIVTAVILSIVLSSLCTSGIIIGIPGIREMLRGPQGPEGEQGPIGPKGDKGEPAPKIIFAQWEVHWYTIKLTLEWDKAVGTSTFSPIFDYNWGTKTIFSEYTELIGFEAFMQVNIQRNGPVTFTIGSDDGSRLFVDGIEIINNWDSHLYLTKSTTINLSQGIHTLTLHYYNVASYARVSFSCDLDVLMWYENT